MTVANCALCRKAKSNLMDVENNGKIVQICRDCAVQLGLIEPTVEELLGDFKLKTPKEIFDAMDKIIVGHYHAKRILATEIYKHYLRLLNGDRLKKDNKKIRKSNVLLTGPTGVGKTYLVQTLAEILGVPFAIADATSITETGYVGEDVENVVLNLLINCDFNVKKAEIGIIYIDEIDKLAMKGENMSITRDVSGEGVQTSLLKLLEGHRIRVPINGGRKHPLQQTIEVDTTNILFIAGGAFTGIEDIVRKRIGINKSIGFGNEIYDKNSISDSYLRKNITVEDLLKYGFKREFLGRFPKIANLEYLTEDDLTKILKVKHGILEEYETFFELMGKKLVVTDAALKEIAKKAQERGTGSRGLKSIMEEIMEDIMFEAPSNDTFEYIITDEDIRKFYDKQFKKIA